MTQQQKALRDIALRDAACARPLPAAEHDEHRARIDAIDHGKGE